MTGSPAEPLKGRRFLRLLGPMRSIRITEVLVLQGTPIFGMLFAIGTISFGAVAHAAWLLAASCCLVAHVFVFNDWSGLDGDLCDPHRASDTFVARGVTRRAVGHLAALLAIAAVAILLTLGLDLALLGLGVITCSAFYSAPGLHWKGVPVANSMLHIGGGILHFLMGYALFSPLDPRGFAIGAFFALTFAAGHLTHEARDWEGDSANRIDTNAVRFGRRAAVCASLALFALAYMLLAGLAYAGAVPRAIGWTAALFALHLLWTIRALRMGLTFDTLRGLQLRYRLLFMAIGAIMVASLAPGLFA